MNVKLTKASLFSLQALGKCQLANIVKEMKEKLDAEGVISFVCR
jgi:hypothetical protein